MQITPRLSAHALQAVADDLKQSSAWEALEAAKLTWKERLPEQPSTWLAWLIALPQAELLDLLAFCTTTTLNALPSSGATSEANAVAAAVGLDMAMVWTPHLFPSWRRCAKLAVLDQPPT